jgi:hypothetical protein
MHEKSNVETMIAGLTVGVTRSAQDSGMAKLTPLHREVVRGMPSLPEQEVYPPGRCCSTSASRARRSPTRWRRGSSSEQERLTTERP